MSGEPPSTAGRGAPAPKQAAGLRGRLESFRCAGRGISDLVATQTNARIHAVATLAACGLAAWLGLSALEWAVLALAISSVWVAEGLNTALEWACDVASPDFHPLARRTRGWKTSRACAVAVSIAA